MKITLFVDSLEIAQPGYVWKLFMSICMFMNRKGEWRDGEMMPHVLKPNDRGWCFLNLW